MNKNIMQQAEERARREIEKRSGAAKAGLANPVEALPRYELREHSCKRFEKVIGQAIDEGTQYIDTKDATKLMEMFSGKGKGMTGRTLTARLNDALLGFKKYKYLSKCIKPGFDLNNLTAKEGPDGFVILYNMVDELRKQADEVGMIAMGTTSASFDEKGFRERIEKVRQANLAADLNAERYFSLKCSPEVIETIAGILDSDDNIYHIVLKDGETVNILFAFDKSTLDDE